jgi:phage antirepressor YoqD-like protein
MNNNIEIFNFSPSIQLRGTVVKDKPWLFWEDVVEIMQIERPELAVQFLRLDEILVTDEWKILNGKRPKGESVINCMLVSESGTYALSAKSRSRNMPVARKWLVELVFPTLKMNTREGREIQEKLEIYDTLVESEFSTDLGEVAKLLKIYPMGRNKLMEIMRHNGILIKRGNYSVPLQSYINAGYFAVSEKVYHYGRTHGVSLKTYVSQKGLDFCAKNVNNWVDNYLEDAYIARAGTQAHVAAF